MNEKGEIASCEIKDGAYHLTAPIGHVTISIMGGDKTEPIKGGQNMERYFAEKKKEREKLKKAFAEGKIKELPHEPMRVPRKYGDLSRSGLGLDIKTGQQTHNFDLPSLPEEGN